MKRTETASQTAPPKLTCGGAAGASAAEEERKDPSLVSADASLSSLQPARTATSAGGVSRVSPLHAGLFPQSPPGAGEYQDKWLTEGLMFTFATLTLWPSVSGGREPHLRPRLVFLGSGFIYLFIYFSIMPISH